MLLINFIKFSHVRKGLLSFPGVHALTWICFCRSLALSHARQPVSLGVITAPHIVSGPFVFSVLTDVLGEWPVSNKYYQLFTEVQLTVNATIIYEWKRRTKRRGEFPWGLGEVNLCTLSIKGLKGDGSADMEQVKCDEVVPTVTFFKFGFIWIIQ